MAIHHPEHPEDKTFVLRHPSGITASISTYGAILRELLVATRNGQAVDVVQGYPHIADYPLGNPYQGAVIGRVANRIRDSRFTLEGRIIRLEANHGEHQLHGGPMGLHNRDWEVTAINDTSINLRTMLPDGASGFPGELTADVRYLLTDHRTLRIELEASTTATTLVNLTHHAYFNLEGLESRHVQDHELTVFSDAYTPSDAWLIPTGEQASVEGTILDLRKSRRLSELLASGDPLLQAAGGLDHNFILRKGPHGPAYAARLVSERSGLVMDTWTTQPGLQVYTANKEGSAQPGKHGLPHGIHSAICLECQGFPDAIHHAGFPNCILQPGEVYHQVIEYRFSDLPEKS